MRASDEDLQRNDAATSRLSALVERLQMADLERSLGGGWTVAFALAHLAFWDARQHVALQGYDRGEGFPPEDKAVNDTLEAVAPLLRGEAAGQEAVRAAMLVDATVAGLSEAQRMSLAEEGVGFAVQRWQHREDHIAQIEAVLR
ncbi:MAG: hypothetical protein F4Y92_08245 [Dehalococcoidia bacterium]|nr:hypothetical protein [Dehalococcoidia bacterium]